MAEVNFTEFANKTLQRADIIIRSVGIELFSKIIFNTPVGDPDLWEGLKKDAKGHAMNAPEGYVGGRLKANWRCSLGMADTSTDESTEKGRSTPDAIKTCNTANRKSKLWLSNSLPYAYTIEYDGHSRQAPAGMVRKNTLRFQTILAAVIRKTKGGGGAI